MIDVRQVIEVQGPSAEVEFAAALDLQFYYDDQRHLICTPYTVDNLHRMAASLGIKRCWFHARPYPHYDIPKNRIWEMCLFCWHVTNRDIIRIIKASGVKRNANKAKG